MRMFILIVSCLAIFASSAQSGTIPSEDPGSGDRLPSPGSIASANQVTNHSNINLINNRSCGPAASDRVLRGSATTWNEFPWMALLAYKVNGTDDSSFKCGGTLINKRYILTAAHCVRELPNGDMLSGVRIGEHDLGQEKDCIDGVSRYCADKYQDFSVESVHIHEEYRSVNRENDIALIRIDRDAVFGRSVTTSCLPVGNATTPMVNNGFISGWGATERGIRNQTMLRGNIVIVSNEECARNLDNGGVVLSHKQFCAVGRTDEASCIGDSGGSFQSPALLDGDVHYVQYGIVSIRPQQCKTNGTVVYTKVSFYVKWILDHIKNSNA